MSTALKLISTLGKTLFIRGLKKVELKDVAELPPQEGKRNHIRSGIDGWTMVLFSSGRNDRNIKFRGSRPQTAGGDPRTESDECAAEDGAPATYDSVQAADSATPQPPRRA